MDMSNKYKLIAYFNGDNINSCKIGYIEDQKDF